MMHEIQWTYFKKMFLENFDYSGQIGISHLPNKEMLMITLNTLGFFLHYKIFTLEKGNF